MADRKITDLTALAAGSQATGDLLTIVDVSEGAAADKNKKITVESLFKGIPSNVGIGTSAPGRQLTLSHASQAAIGLLSGADTSGGLIYQNASEQKVLLANRESDGHIAFQTGGVNERMRINSSGQVGIGTSSINTNAKLDVNAGSLPVVANFDTTATGGGAAYFKHSGVNKMIVGTAGSSALSGSSVDDGLIRTEDNLIIATGGNTERMRIDSSGNLGLNTSSPTSVLHIKSDTNNNVNNGFLFEAADSTHKIFRLYENGTGEAYSRWYYQDTAKVLIRTNGASYFNGGKVGIGTDSPGQHLTIKRTGGQTQLSLISDTNESGAIYFGDTASTNRGVVLYDHGQDSLQLYTAGSERMRIDSSGRVGIKNSSPGSQYFNDLVIGDGSGDHGITLHTGSSNSSSIAFSDATSGSGRYAGYLQYDHNDNSMKFYTNGGNERMRIVSTGYAQFGGYLVETNNHRINGINDNQGDTILVVSGYQSSGGSSQDTAMFYAVSSGGSVSQSGAGLRMYRNTSTNRSINTAGTINASGADYAEYMTKAGDFTLAKGDICGINSEGKLTNVFADAISFVVKSTDPSYVGGDTWHTAAGEKPGGYDDDRTEEEIAAATVAYEEALEAARQLVDRIAFSGQVPVNVTGATPGQHIIPTAAADGSIEGTAKTEADLTMAEYMSSVGKVIAIEDDGRAKIIVKVA